MNLEHVPNSSKVPARKRSISCRHSNMLMALCAACSIETWVWTSTQNSSGTVRPAYSGEFFAHRDTRAKSSRPCRMVAVLLIREYIGKYLSAVWVSALVPDYAPRSWRIKCMCIHCESKCINARQNDSKTRTINHTCIPHRNGMLADCHRHQRRFSKPSNHSDIVIRVPVLFEH